MRGVASSSTHCGRKPSRQTTGAVKTMSIVFYVHCFPKKGSHQTFGNNFLNLNRFSKFFHCWIEDEYFQQNYVIFSTTPELCCCTTLEGNSSNLLQITTEKIKKVSYLTKMKRLCCRTVDWRQAYCFYSICSKCPPFACMHARKRLCHSSMHCQWCSGRRYATLAVHTVSVRQCRAPATGTLAVGRRSKSCNQPD